ncbi:hypothetical protein ACPJXG_23020 [Janthinobacterium sp. NFX145]|uniref:hypothetical protein n=1 Tax=Janthinobacterium sp. NFX145 TaxID=3415602 RepID=UPI003CC5ED1D
MDKKCSSDTGRGDFSQPREGCHRGMAWHGSVLLALPHSRFARVKDAAHRHRPSKPAFYFKLLRSITAELFNAILLEWRGYCISELIAFDYADMIF